MKRRFNVVTATVLAALSCALFHANHAAAQPPARKARPAQPAAPAAVPAGVRAIRDLAYVENGHERQKLDLYLPEGADKPLPVIVWVHGGGWMGGSKSLCLPLRSGYVGQGYAVASVGYRLSGDAIFPAQLEDCKAAIRYLRAHADEYGLDTDRIAAWGSSAGGHLVALLGTTGDVKEFDVGENLDQSSRVQAVCDFFGPTDLVAFVRTPNYTRHASPESPESRLLGGKVEDVPDRAARANPITFVTADDPPFLIVHGSADRTVPPNQSELLQAALAKAGIESKHHTIDGAGHGGEQFSAPEVASMVDEFLSRNLRHEVAARPAAPNAAAQSSAARSAETSPAPPRGLLYFASYAQRDNTAAAANPHILGALHTVYWSDVERSPGVYDWSDLDRRVSAWTSAGKKVAVRIMWVSSGGWPEPAAKHPTPQFVLDEGAAYAQVEYSNSQVPLVWDPIYRRHAARFLAEVARKFDGDTNVLFVDVTPGAETNPYRFRRINVQEPEFKTRFLETADSDGRKYSDALWLETVQQGVGAAAAIFQKTPILVTLNVGTMDGPEQFQTIGDYCVERGAYVGQNGLNGRSYAESSPRKTAFADWGRRTLFYFEMVDASGGGTGGLMEVMRAAERVGCDYLGVYAVDVLRGTRGQPNFDPAYEEALAYGARAIAAAPPYGAPAVADAAAPAAIATPPAEAAADERVEIDLSKKPVVTDFKQDGERFACLVDGRPMRGILLMPEGPGPHPGILISHGLGGAAASFGLSKAREVVKWGFVCIAPDYTHVGTPGGRPAGARPAPGTAPRGKGGARPGFAGSAGEADARARAAGMAGYGASPENIQRARACLEILRTRANVAHDRIAAYGHSMGGFVTIALAATAGDELRAAAISGSGVAPREGFAAPSVDEAKRIRTPFLMVHGALDRTVRPEQSASLAEALEANGVPNERHVIDDADHPVDRTNAEEVFSLLRGWFTTHGVLTE